MPSRCASSTARSRSPPPPPPPPAAVAGRARCLADQAHARVRAPPDLKPEAVASRRSSNKHNMTEMLRRSLVRHPYPHRVHRPLASTKVDPNQLELALLNLSLMRATPCRRAASLMIARARSSPTRPPDRGWRRATMPALSRSPTPASGMDEANAHAREPSRSSPPRGGQGQPGWAVDGGTASSPRRPAGRRASTIRLVSGTCDRAVAGRWRRPTCRSPSRRPAGRIGRAGPALPRAAVDETPPSCRAHPR